MANSMPTYPATPSRSLARILPRRRWLVVALMLSLGVVGTISLCRGPALSALERQLVGAWGLPQMETPRDMGVPAGPMTNPYQVVELCQDRVVHFWFASGDNLAQRYIISEGRWRIDNGKLLFEDMPVTSPHRVISDIGRQIEKISGYSLTSLRLYAPHRLWSRSEPFRLAGASRLEMSSARGDLLTLNRLPDWKR